MFRLATDGFPRPTWPLVLRLQFYSLHNANYANDKCHAASPGNPIEPLFNRSGLAQMLDGVRLIECFCHAHGCNAVGISQIQLRFGIDQ